MAEGVLGPPWPDGDGILETERTVLARFELAGA